MTMPKARGAVVPALVVSALLPLASAVPTDAGSTRTSGTGRSVHLGWTEYDPDDLLGLPGNVHVGYLYAESGPYGSFVYGNVTDFECEPGESPWGSHGDAVAVIVDDAAAAVEDATEDAIDAAVEGGGGVIESGDVVASIAQGIGEEVPDEVVDEVDPACDYVQDRFLDGSETATMTVDMRRQVATISGQLVVHGGHGEHGEPGVELGRPAVDVTISGGDWNEFEWSYSSRGAGWSYRDSQKGKSYNGGAVSGAIGAMGFADDADDESWGGFAQYRYRTVERLR